MRVRRIWIVGSQFSVQGFVLIPVRSRQLPRYVMNAFTHRSEALQRSVPAENIVVTVILASAGFDDGNAGKQAPNQCVAVGRRQEIGGNFAQWAIPRCK